MSQRHERLAVALGLALGVALITYGGAGTATRATASTDGGAGPLSRARASADGSAGTPSRATASTAVVASGAHASKRPKKLRAALETCRKERPARKRRKCEKKALSKFGGLKGAGPKHSRQSAPEVPAGVPVEKRPPPPPVQETPQEELNRLHEPRIATGGGIENGAPLYAAQCEICHGPHGEGTATGSNLHEEEQAWSINGVIAALIEPRPGAMPNFDKTFTFQEKEYIANYVTVEITETEFEIP